MANIIKDEKRFLNVGEICAIKLNSIFPVYFMIDPGNGHQVNFLRTFTGLTDEDDITVVKYLGNGMFEDLITNQFFMMAIYSCLEIDEFDSLDINYQDELEKISSCYSCLSGPINPDNYTQIQESISFYINNPLVIGIYNNPPFMTLDDDILKKICIDKVKEKILSVKLIAQQKLQHDYGESEDKIIKGMIIKKKFNYKN